MRLRSSFAATNGRLTLVLACALAVAAAACGSGDKPRAADAPQPALTAAAGTATALAPTATPRPAPTEVPVASSDEVTGSNVLSLLLGGAVGGSSPADALGAGDPVLKDYVLQASDLPSGYQPLEGATTLRSHDGISGSGTIDIALALFSRGDPRASDGAAVGSMAMHFSDLQDLDKAIGDINADALQAQLGGAGLPDGIVKDIKTLPTDGLGDHATGFSFTMDLEALFGGFAGALGGESRTPVALPSAIPTQIHMEMYIFAHGSYAGAVLAVTYGGSASGLDLLSLAKTADGRLATAP